MMLRNVVSSRVPRNSAELMGGIMSPACAGFGPPWPNCPWQTEQFAAKSWAPFCAPSALRSRPSVLHQCLQLLGCQDLAPHRHRDMCTAAIDDLAGRLHVGRRWHPVPMTHRAVLAKENLAGRVRQLDR